MGVCRVRHSQRLMEFLSAECQVRGNPVTLVKPAHDFSTQRHRLRGGRDSQPGLSYSNRAGSHTSPQDVGRQIRCAFCSAKWSKMMGFSGFRTRFVLIAPRHSSRRAEQGCHTTFLLKRFRSAAIWLQSLQLYWPLPQVN